MFSFENFTENYNREKLLQLELEKIELASLKLKEEYKDYQELVAFIDYLRSSEQLFAMSKAQNWAGERLKEELIKNELRVSALNTGVNEEVFHSIYSEFKNLSANIDRVYQATEELLIKYNNCSACVEFINFLRNITVLFLENEKEKISLDETKERIFKIKMQSLSVAKKIEIGMLEEIYEEFKNKLK